MTTKRLSRAMAEMLGQAIVCAGGPGATVRAMPPTHHENRVTHDALVRRGLVRVDADGYIEVTDAGRAEHTRRTAA
jgi:hypothetical protein